MFIKFILFVVLVAGALVLIVFVSPRLVNNIGQNSKSLADIVNSNSSSSATLSEFQTITPSTAPTASAEAQVTNLITEDIKLGTGSAEVKSGDNIVINYIGKLTNGKIFDNSYQRGEPLKVQIGVGQVIEGWDRGVLGMRVGGQRRLIIPPGLGYGDKANGPIPANSTLIFDLELVGIEGQE